MEREGRAGYRNGIGLIDTVSRRGDFADPRRKRIPDSWGGGEIIFSRESSTREDVLPLPWRHEAPNRRIEENILETTCAATLRHSGSLESSFLLFRFPPPPLSRRIDITGQRCTARLPRGLYYFPTRYMPRSRSDFYTAGQVRHSRQCRAAITRVRARAVRSLINSSLLIRLVSSLKGEPRDTARDRAAAAAAAECNKHGAGGPRDSRGWAGGAGGGGVQPPNVWPAALFRRKSYRARGIA